MKRAGAFAIGMSLWLAGVWLGGAPGAAAAQQAEHAGVPRTLRDGKPARRFSGRGRPEAAKTAPPRATPAPSVVLDRSTLLGRDALEGRSAQLLERELAVLRRLLNNTALRDPRRPDVLLRLAHAYQELMFQQKQRIHRLQEASGRDCRCSATAVACREPAAASELVAAR